jgi:hypothetical protein
MITKSRDTPKRKLETYLKFLFELLSLALNNSTPTHSLTIILIWILRRIPSNKFQLPLVKRPIIASSHFCIIPPRYSTIALVGRPILGLAFAGTIGCDFASATFGEGGATLAADFAAVIGLV